MIVEVTSVCQVTESNRSPGTVVLLTRLSRLVYRRSGEERLGMRLKEFVTLVHLRDQNHLSQQALGEAMCLDANNLVLLLNDLETADLVTRRRDPVDRRRHIVEITPTGLAAVERAERSMESVEDEVLAGLDGGERDQLRQLLTQALDNSPELEATPVQSAAAH
jgi:MarR family transcriptional regulator, temperature-dependent positive regulator of motility